MGYKIREYYFNFFLMSLEVTWMEESFMKQKIIFNVLLALCIIPFFGQVGASSNQEMKEAPDIEKLHATKADFDFTLYVDKAEIKAKGNNFLLIVPKTPRNYQFVFQSTEPKEIAGTVPAEMMMTYWKPGSSFEKIPPMAIIIGIFGEKNKTPDVNYAVNITSMSDDGKNLVFDMIPFAKQTQMVKEGKYHTLVITIDSMSAGGAA